MSRQRVAMLTPLPPTPTGVAHYASLLIPALSAEVDLTAFGSPEGYDAADYGVAIYQLGNNRMHEWIYREAIRRPGIAVLHDVVLHHLLAEITLARGDAEGYADALRASHGAAGEAWARGRAAGLHSEIGNFLLPASIDLANRSRAVIVHNTYAARWLRSLGVRVPIEVVAHPRRERAREDTDAPGDAFAARLSSRAHAVRERLGLSATDRIIGFFGFVTAAKRGEVVVEAFRLARLRDRRLRLLIVGEPSPTIDLDAFLGDGVVATGYAEESEFDQYYTAVDRIVNLRYPSAGETSGSLIRALDAGKPVAVSRYAQFGDIPEPVAFHIPLGDGEVESLVDFFLRDIDGAAVAAAQRQWLGENSRTDLTVAGYRRAIDRSGAAETADTAATAATLPLFFQIELADALLADSVVAVTLRNRSGFTLRARDYGVPNFNVVVRLSEGMAVEVHHARLWRDVRDGEEIVIDVPTNLREPRIALYGAVDTAPEVVAVPFAERTLRHAR